MKRYLWASIYAKQTQGEKNTNDAFAMITNVIQTLLKKSKSNKEKIIKVRNPKLNTSLLM